MGQQWLPPNRSHWRTPPSGSSAVERPGSRQQAIDHGFFIIWDLAMGGNYPDGVSGTTTPTSATTSGAGMSAAYAAVYEQGGNSTPTGTPTATGAVGGLNGLCLANQNSLNVAGNPIGVSACNGGAGQQWSPYTDGTLRTQGGCLDVVSAGKTSGTNVDWYPCKASAAQNWTHQAGAKRSIRTPACVSPIPESTPPPGWTSRPAPAPPTRGGRCPPEPVATP